jgi:hypothetical protein
MKLNVVAALKAPRSYSNGPAKSRLGPTLSLDQVGDTHLWPLPLRRTGNYTWKLFSPNHEYSSYSALVYLTYIELFYEVLSKLPTQ